jgi:hypothetical protein
MKLAFRGKCGRKIKHKKKKLKLQPHTTEWIGFTSQNRQEDPPEPDEVETSMRGDQDRYIEFADRMIRAVHGKSIFSSKAATTDFEDLVMPSQEAFTLAPKKWI